VDTTLLAHRAGAGNRALRIGLGSVFFVLALSLQMILVLWGFIETPISASLFFLAILGVMSFELGSDVLRAAKLSTTLQAREKELRRERDLSNAVFENAPGLIQLHSPEGKILRWNSGGKPPSAFWELFHKDDRPKAEQAWRSALTNGRSEFELRLDGGESKSRNFFFTAAGADIDGAPHVVAVGVDTTALQDLAAEFARQREDLAHLAKVAAVSELSSSLAHEINQPLAIILSNSEAAQRLLERDAPDLGELRDILKDIVSADIRAAEVIRRLRAILKRGEPVLEPVQPVGMVDRALQILEQTLDSAGVQVSRRIPKRLPSLLADRIPIEQVLINLIKNAIEAMADNGAKGKSLAISCAPEGNGIRFSVRDNGAGLPESAERIFEAFHTTKPDGLGLGLKICNTIILAHGGRLWAENNKSRGATFHFHLPCQPELL
jgi:C4-dicarboxylate-specific signal transduction histidine kinase